jgi:hypothetical protein
VLSSAEREAISALAHDLPARTGLGSSCWMTSPTPRHVPSVADQRERTSYRHHPSTRRRHRRRGRVVDVGVFSAGESLQYLTEKLEAGVLKSELVRADLEALASDLGHLPLALTQAAAVIIDEGFTRAEYRRLVKSPPAQTTVSRRSVTHHASCPQS